LLEVFLPAATMDSTFYKNEPEPGVLALFALPNTCACSPISFTAIMVVDMPAKHKHAGHAALARRELQQASDRTLPNFRMSLT